MASARQWATQVLHGNEKTLASIRMSRGMSQHQLAEACNMKQPHISRYENGRNEPGVIAAQKISEILHISVDEFTKAFLNTRKRIENDTHN